MTENKRFTTTGYKIYDTFHDGVHWLVNEVEAQYIVDKMNNLDLKARERSKALSKLQKENEQLKKELFKTKKDYLIETSDEVDRVLYVPDEIEELRENIFEKGVYDD